MKLSPAAASVRPVANSGTVVASASRGRRVLERPIGAAVVLLLFYVAASFFMDPMGSLGTDTGGKVATLEVMADRPIGLDPGVGYWAADRDPDAEFHGLYYTSRIGDRFVNVTTLPMLELGAPLYRFGGYRAALLLPMLGAIAASFAGRRLAQRVGADDRTAWRVFWLLGLASPLAIYALDFWEHTLGVALLLWGFVALLAAVDEDRMSRVLRWGVLAGLSFGVAYSMRTEALVYAFVATAVVCGYLLADRRWREMLTTGAGAVVGLVGAVLANTALEVMVLGESFRSGRASGTVGAGGSGLVLRLKEAILTGTGLFSDLGVRSLLVAGAFAVALLATAYYAGRPGGQRIAAVAGASAMALFVVRLGQGVGFVPGMLAAVPLAAVGIVRLPHHRSARMLGAIALASLPFVWLFQYTGGAAPQWAGRYILTSGIVLAVLGVVALCGAPVWLRRYFVAASIVVTLAGLVWLVERSHEVGEAARAVAAFPEDAVVSTQAFWLRELGAVYAGEETKWLSVRDQSVLEEALTTLQAQDVDSFALLGVGDVPPPVAEIEGFSAIGERNYRWLGVPFVAVTYVRDD